MTGLKKKKLIKFINEFVVYIIDKNEDLLEDMVSKETENIEHVLHDLFSDKIWGELDGWDEEYGKDGPGDECENELRLAIEAALHNNSKKISDMIAGGLK